MAERNRIGAPIEAQVRREIVGGLILAVLLAIFLAFWSWNSARRVEQDSYWVSHTYQVMAAIQSASRHVIEAETSAREFASSGQEPLLKHYQTARESLFQDENTLRRLTADNLSQQRRLDVLVPQVQAGLDFAESIIAKRRNHEDYPDGRGSLETERLIAVMEATTQDMQTEEARLLGQRIQDATTGQRVTRVVTISGALLEIGFWVLGLLVVIREIHISAEARSQLNTLNAELERRVELRTAALHLEVAERRRTQEIAERLAAVVESSGDAIISKTLDGIMTGWNLGAEKVFGYSPLEAVGKHVALLLPPERADEESAIMARIRRGESVEHFDTVRLRKDGRKIDVSVTISPIRDSSGAIVGASKVARDISERKHAEEALRESEKRFHAMLDGIPQLAWMAEPDGNLFWFNQRWYDYTGTTAEQTKGWNWQSLHDPEILPEVLDTWKAAIAGGTPFEMEFPLRAEDGHFCMFLPRIVPLKDSNGRVIRWFGTNTDISERKRAEVKLADQAQELARRAEELANSRLALETQSLMLQSVLESMGEGLIAADREGHFLIWNDSAKNLMGRDASNLPTKDWTPHYKVFLPDGVTPCSPDRLPLVRALRGESVQMELMVERPGPDSGVFLEVTARPLKGTLGGGVAVLRDITERKAAEREIKALNQSLEARVVERTAELKASNNELEAFTYSVSHDLRAPLRHISGFTKILVEKFRPSLPPEAQEFLQLIAQGASRMGQMVDEMLKLARVSRQPLKVEVTGLNSLVKDVVTLLSPETEGRRVQWKIGELPFVECDAVLMRQVFQNLIGNALKYSRPRSPAVIEIGCVEMDGEEVIFVKDNGVGFEMEYADHLFGVFQRLHREEEFEGTGIGLATVARIIQKHGGRVWVQAELDRGATFYFTLGGAEPLVHKNTAAAIGVS